MKNKKPAAKKAPDRKLAAAQNRVRSINKTFRKGPKKPAAKPNPEAPAPAAKEPKPLFGAAARAVARRTGEANLWEWLRDGVENVLRVRGDLPKLHWNRIESGTTASGILDVEGCYNARSFWIELKSVPRPIKGGIVSELSPEQAMFLRVRQKAGGNAWILLRVAGLNDAGTVYLIAAKHATALLKPVYEARLRAISEWVEDPIDILETIRAAG